jgi:hypothetical protein
MSEEKKSFNPIKGLENIQELPPVEEKPTEPVESVEEQSEEKKMLYKKRWKHQNQKKQKV